MATVDKRHLRAVAYALVRLLCRTDGGPKRHRCLLRCMSVAWHFTDVRRCDRPAVRVGIRQTAIGLRLGKPQQETI
jgi:hypothetical protein